MFTANAPERAIATPVADSRFMQTSSIGGSSASEVTALAVVPCRPPSAVAVMTVTPLAKCPMTLRNSPGVSRRAPAVSVPPAMVRIVSSDKAASPTQGGRDRPPNGAARQEEWA